MTLSPGWYPTPHDATKELYWDGDRWTETRDLVEGAGRAKEAEDLYGVKTKFGVGFAFLLSLILLIIIAVAVLYFTNIDVAMLGSTNTTPPPDQLK